MQQTYHLIGKQREDGKNKEEERLMVVERERESII